MKFKRLFAILLLKRSLIIQLVSWAPIASSNEDNPLKQKIDRFREKYPNVQITIN
ncbi:hypothetical protein MHH56_24455 [Paenibacillus sp. FSL K6-3182]|uniref:hypothetical protein n=1 Tax=unclassified Paenibacillus TaxID=185978 RepID=UPI0030D290D1